LTRGPGAHGPIVLVLVLRRRRTRMCGIYRVNARAPRVNARYSDWRRRKAGTSSGLAASSRTA